MIINTRPKILSSKLNSLSYDKNLKVINAPLSSVESLTFNIDTINLKSRLQENGYYKNIIFTSQASAIFGLASLKEIDE
jgi:uroporphyrinogen-III synthase